MKTNLTCRNCCWNCCWNCWCNCWCSCCWTCWWNCCYWPPRRILKYESHYGQVTLSKDSVTCSGQSGSQELDLLKMVALAGAWLLKEPKWATLWKDSVMSPSGSSKSHGALTLCFYSVTDHLSIDNSQQWYRGFLKSQKGASHYKNIV